MPSARTPEEAKAKLVELLEEIEKRVEERTEKVKAVHNAHDSEMLLATLGHAVIVLAATVRVLVRREEL